MFGRAKACLERVETHPASRWMSKIDIFGFQPLPRHQKRAEQSVVASVFALAVIVLMLFYIITTLIRFANFNPTITTSLSSVQAGDNIHVGPGTGLDFAVVFRPGPLNVTFYDERYFNYNMRLTTINDQDESPRDYQQITFAPCDFTARWIDSGVNPGFLGKNAACPMQATELYGSYAQHKYTFFQIDVRICNNATRPDCVPEDQVWATFLGGRLNFLFVQQDFDPTNGAKVNHYETTYYFFKRDAYQLNELFFRKKVVSIQPDYIRRPFQIDDQTVLFEREKSYTTDPFNGITLTVFLRFDTIIDNQVWSVQTIFDLLGSWSAFFGTLSVTLGAIALAYNTSNFYKRSPAWDDFDDQFQSHGGAARGTGNTGATQAQGILMTS